MQQTLDSLRLAAREPKNMDVPVDDSPEGLLVIHAWRWCGYMENSVAIGSDKDLLIKEVCAQRARVRELERDTLESRAGTNEEAVRYLISAVVERRLNSVLNKYDSLRGRSRKDVA